MDEILAAPNVFASLMMLFASLLRLHLLANLSLDTAASFTASLLSQHFVFTTISTFVCLHREQLSGKNVWVFSDSTKNTISQQKHEDNLFPAQHREHVHKYGLKLVLVFIGIFFGVLYLSEFQLLGRNNKTI